jgi:hypothetical protein
MNLGKHPMQNVARTGRVFDVNRESGDPSFALRTLPDQTPTQSTSVSSMHVTLNRTARPRISAAKPPKIVRIAFQFKVIMHSDKLPVKRYRYKKDLMDVIIPQAAV